MLPRGAICSQFFFQEVVAKVAHMTVEAFVLSGSHALRPMPHNLSWGLASARRRGHSVHEGRAHLLVGEFCQNFARLPRRAEFSHSCCQKS